jgi:aminoglycoside phosphotransferase (APT) family kinase protein
VLGAAATALARSLARTQPAEGAPRLVHGSLHARHILDAGDGPGLIDWRNFGQGPAELDAAAFLATLRRSALRHELVAGEATRAEEALLAGTAGLLDERALVWHRAAALLRLAHKKVSFGMGDRLAGAHALVAEATRLAERAARPVSVARRKTPAFSLNFPALELVLQALSTRPATPDELDQLRKLLDETRDRTS